MRRNFYSSWNAVQLEREVRNASPPRRYRMGKGAVGGTAFWGSQLSRVGSISRAIPLEANIKAPGSTVCRRCRRRSVREAPHVPTSPGGGDQVRRVNRQAAVT